MEEGGKEEGEEGEEGEEVEQRGTGMESHTIDESDLTWSFSQRR
jgi:hypothetical protein